MEKNYTFEHHKSSSSESSSSAHRKETSHPETSLRNFYDTYPSLEEKIDIKDPNASEEEFKNKVFDFFVIQEVTQDFIDTLTEVGYVNSPEDEKKFLQSLHSFSVDEMKKILSFPYEIRPRVLKNQMKKNTPIDELPEKLLEIAKKNNFDIGYHVSGQNILPQSRNDGGEIWEIAGTEADHRDQDRLMAYYSLDYANLYTEKGAQYIYVVRIQSGDQGAHKVDEGNNWGRADSLSVVTQIKDLNRIKDFVEEQARLRNVYLQKKTASP